MTVDRQVDAAARTAFARSFAQHEKALQLLPGGVSSNLRALEQPVPLTIASGQGSRVRDLDGNELIDFQLGQGALLLGHADPEWCAAIERQLREGTHFAAGHELEITVAQRVVSGISSVELVRFTSSATEAVLTALRLARAHTGRDLILRFEGHYHGWTDEGLAGFAPPPSSWDQHGSVAHHPSTGVSPEMLERVIVARWNDSESLRALVSRFGDRLAAIIFEPIMLNTGCIPADASFIDALHEARRASDCLLICDETIAGVRFGPSGAQGVLAIRPDLTILGKALAAGVPIAAVGGTSAVMELLTRREVVHGGTLNGNPLCLAAANAVLERATATMIAELDGHARELAEGFRETARQAELPLVVRQAGSVVYTMFVRDVDAPMREYRDVVQNADMDAWTELRTRLLLAGVRPLERGVWYLSSAHDDADVSAANTAFASAIAGFRTARQSRSAETPTSERAKEIR